MRNYADVTMADIAQEADVTKGALYQHFESKEDLYLLMRHDLLGAMGESLSEAVVAGKGCGLIR